MLLVEKDIFAIELLHGGEADIEYRVMQARVHLRVILIERNKLYALGSKANAIVSPTKQWH